MAPAAFPPELPLPPHFNGDQVSLIRRIPSQSLASRAQTWTQEHNISPASQDTFRLALVLIDVQNTFCIPGFELYVGGRSGTGAVDDNRRLAGFIYRNLNRISQIVATMDTHFAVQIFHPIYLVDSNGANPDPHTAISARSIEQGEWLFNPLLAASLGITPDYGQAQLLHYVRQLEAQGKYALTIWPYHAMLGGIGHALVPGIEEAIFFHTIARSAQPQMILKGDSPFTESYSAVGPEVLQDPAGKPLGQRKEDLPRLVEECDAVILCGQAKSHCVAWTVADLLDSLNQRNPNLIHKIYLLEDCTSPVVVPGAADYTAEADAAFERFRQAGMHVVRSTDPIASWPDTPNWVAHV